MAKGSSSKNQLVETRQARVRRALDQWQEVGELFVERTLTLAVELKEARESCGNSDTQFGAWLIRHDCNDLSKDTRAALIQIALHPDLFRQKAIETGSHSVEWTWKRHMKPDLSEHSDRSPPIKKPREACAYCHKSSGELVEVRRRDGQTAHMHFECRALWWEEQPEQAPVTAAQELVQEEAEAAAEVAHEPETQQEQALREFMETATLTVEAAAYCQHRIPLVVTEANVAMMQSVLIDAVDAWTGTLGIITGSDVMVDRLLTLMEQMTEEQRSKVMQVIEDREIERSGVGKRKSRKAKQKPPQDPTTH